MAKHREVKSKTGKSGGVGRTGKRVKRAAGVDPIRRRDSRPSGTRRSFNSNGSQRPSGATDKNDHGNHPANEAAASGPANDTAGCGDVAKGAPEEVASIEQLATAQTLVEAAKNAMRLANETPHAIAAEYNAGWLFSQDWSHWQVFVKVAKFDEKLLESNPETGGLLAEAQESARLDTSSETVAAMEQAINELKEVLDAVSRENDILRLQKTVRDGVISFLEQELAGGR